MGDERAMVVGEGNHTDAKQAVKNALKQAVSNFELGEVRVVSLSHNVVVDFEGKYQATVILAVEWNESRNDFNKSDKV